MEQPGKRDIGLLLPGGGLLLALGLIGFLSLGVYEENMAQCNVAIALAFAGLVLMLFSFVSKS